VGNALYFIFKEITLVDQTKISTLLMQRNAVKRIEKTDVSTHFKNIRNIPLGGVGVEQSFRLETNITFTFLQAGFKAINEI